MIVCQACSHSNPLGRVFCQKCGTKLDLSRVRAPGSVDAKGGTGGITIGVRKDEGKDKKRLFKIIVRIFDVLLVAVVAFVIFQVWQEPSVPNIMNSPSDAAKVRTMRDKIEFAIGRKTPYKIEMNDVQLNSYLASVSDMGKSSDTGTFRTEKIALVPEQDLINVMYVRQVVLGSWKKNIVMQFRGRPIAEGGEFRFQRVSGSVGNLGVPSFALGALERNYARLFEGFSTEKALLAKISQFQVEPKKVTLIYEPAK